MKNSHAEVHLGYYKQGDDLGHFLEKKKDPVKALKAHAECMRSVAKHLEEIASVIGKRSKEIDLNGDTHCIWMIGPTEIIKKLISKGLAKKSFDEEDEP